AEARCSGQSAANLVSDKRRGSAPTRWAQLASLRRTLFARQPRYSNARAKSGTEAETGNGCEFRSKAAHPLPHAVSATALELSPKDRAPTRRQWTPAPSKKTNRASEARAGRMNWISRGNLRVSVLLDTVPRRRTSVNPTPSSR